MCIFNVVTCWFVYLCILHFTHAFSKHHVWVMDIPPSLGFPSNGYIDLYFYERINDVSTTAHKPQNGSLKGKWWYTSIDGQIRIGWLEVFLWFPQIHISISLRCADLSQRAWRHTLTVQSLSFRRKNVKWPSNLAMVFV